jgi:hypothetical protein
VTLKKEFMVNVLFQIFLHVGTGIAENWWLAFHYWLA